MQGIRAEALVARPCMAFGLLDEPRGQVFEVPDIEVALLFPRRQGVCVPAPAEPAG